MSENTRTCQVPVSTIFVFKDPQDQLADNMVYVAKKGEYTSSIAGTLPVGKNHTAKLMFKTDYERMQYILGLYGRDSQGLR